MCRRQMNSNGVQRFYGNLCTKVRMQERKRVKGGLRDGEKECRDFTVEYKAMVRMERSDKTCL